jgi:rod shape determining protein RodA
MNLHRLKLDWWIVVPIICLITIGGLFIYSISRNNNELTDYWWQHLMTGGIGFIFLILLSRWNYQNLLSCHWFIYGLTNISLLMVLWFGTIESGAQSWLTIGNFNIQPSEFAKISLIITIGALLHPRPIQNPGDLARILLVVFPSWFLVLTQPDLGTAIVLVAITMGMLYWAGTPLSWLLLLGSPLISAAILAFSIPLWFLWIGVIGLVAWWNSPGVRYACTIGAIIINLVGGELGKIAWHFLHTYQRQRLILFLNPDQDPLGGGYHLIQSRIAIGSGQFWGKGYLHGTQTQLNFIPEQHTDFIFSAIGEEWGFVGSMTVVILFLVLCARLLVIALSTRQNFGSLLAVGMLCLTLFQVFINIGMTIGLAPVTGLPLPFLSYGRAALLAYMIGFGLVMSVSNQPD